MTEEEIRADERPKCWEEINALIAHCSLPERAGLILAADMLLHLSFEPESV